MIVAKIISNSEGQRTEQKCSRCENDIFAITDQTISSITAKCVNCGEPLSLEGEFETEKI